VHCLGDDTGDVELAVLHFPYNAHKDGTVGASSPPGRSVKPGIESKAFDGDDDM